MAKPRKPNKAMAESAQLVDVLKPMFAGRRLTVVGLALGELTAIFLAGLPPPVQETAIREHEEFVRELLDYYNEQAKPMRTVQ